MDRRAAAGGVSGASAAGGAGASRYWDPYLAGVALGLVLLATFVVAGRGLAASGAMARVVAAGVRSAAPEHATGNAFYEIAGASADEDGGRGAWLLVEVLGIALGGLVSAAAAGRLRAEVARGPRLTNRTRLLWAVGGGALMGFGARLARGCTSGQALTGGAQLNLGSWAFMLALFAGGYAATRLARRGWT